MKIFGREPAAWLGLISPVVAVLVAMNLHFLNAGQGAAIVAALTALVLVFTTRPLAPGLLTGLLGTGVALFSEYGLHASDALVGGLTGITLALFALVSRGQVAPQDTPVSRP